MTLNIYTDDSSPMSTSDVESFTGKIVCNIDGSSYIIDSENATLSSLNHNSLCVAAISVTNEKTSILPTTKTASNSCEKSLNLTTTKTTTTKKLSSPNYEQKHLKQLQQAANPKIHTFRVVSANDASIQLRQEKKILKIQKPILMCFICKLSFGITKSFSLHANSEHGLDLQDLENHLLTQREYSSAIIQKNMDENPQISFLEPVSIETPTLSAASSVEDCSGMDAQLENDNLRDLNEKICAQTHNQQNVNVYVSTATATTAAADNVPSSNTSSSSSSSTTSSSSSSSPLSPRCTANSIINTTTTTTTTIAKTSDKPQVVMSPIYDDQQSQCAYDSTPTKTHITTGPLTASTTLSSLNLDKSKTNNYNISNPSSDHLTTSVTATTANNTTISVTSSVTTITSSTTTTTSTPTITLSLQSTTKVSTSSLTSSLSLKTGVDLSALTGNLSTDASSTDSLVDINKYNNSDNSNSNNDSIEPHLQQINNVNKSSNLSPTSHHNQHHHQHQHNHLSTSINTSIMGDFLQQHLQRIAGGSRISDEDTPNKHLEYEPIPGWSQPIASTFSAPATASNVSATQISSLQTSLSALNSDQNSANSVKFISEFLQHQLVAAQHQKQLTYNADMPLNTSNTSVVMNACPEHTDFKGVDCKICEMLEVTQNFKQSPQITPHRSPTSSSIAVNAGMGIPANQLSMSPNNSQNASNMLPGLNSSINTSPLSTPGSASSFTIGACSDHINGRPLGVECARCEMILNSARLNSNVQMSTRNSCKTLKCPQCNWHYKYQETLEIHMREKHPDGESACGYCLAGQQHPRLARGESYSCGYKPYRCEICNYSTTTKGNLSIHMQSDKHLNNMQELNSSQNMVAAAVAVATGGVGKLETTPKITMGNTMNSLAQQQQQHQQQQHALSNSTNNANTNASLTSAVVCGGATSTSVQVSNILQSGNSGSSGVVGGGSIKPKPSFRCDICSYETSVARNLRIHMTSEKHTHNMAVLQNNIKHIQAYTFLQHQQQQQQQTQQQSGNFMPEVALADLAYNQALMIQLLHQNVAAAATAQTQSQPTGPSPLDKSPVAMSANNENVMLKITSPTIMTEMPPSPYSPKSNDFNLNELGATKNLEPPIKPDLWPTTLFSCLVCSNFNTNNLDELNQHLIIDRSRQTAPSHQNSSISPTSNNISSTASAMANNNSCTATLYFSDILMVQNNNYICRLCNYKTNLKANFQLHSKTDKHLQKLNFINHLREGGARNEYKLLYYQQQQQQIGANTVQIKCNSCDFYTNSIQKLSLHTQHMRHETMISIFQHLNYLVQQHQQQASGSGSNDESSSISLSSDTAPQSLVDGTQTTTTTTPASAADCSNTGINKSLHCHLCNFKANSLLEMIQHVKSIRHLQVEQFVCLQRRSEQLETPSLDDVFKLCDKSLPNNDTTAETTSTIPTQSNSIMGNKAAATASCFTSLIETGNEDFHNKMIFEHSEGSDNNSKSGDSKTNLPSNLTLTAHSKEGSEQQTTTTMDVVENTIPNSIPSIIYKCSHCDYFGQIKNEVESHVNSTHPNADSEDVISIPTNPVAIQAFQAAMAAATLAAVSRASTTSYKRSPMASPNTTHTKLCASMQEDDDDMRPVAVKRERLDLVDQETIHDEAASIETNENPNTEAIEPQGVALQTAQRQHGKSVQCPLCQDYFTEKQTLEGHLMTIHSVNTDGLARLLLMVDTKVWQCEDVPAASSTPTAVNEATAPSSIVFNDMQLLPKQSSSAYELLQCQQCGSSFKHEQQLLQHAQKMQHYTQQQGEYMCLAFNSARNSCKMHFPTLIAMFNHYNEWHMSLVISERHVYKYRCKQCSLAFKTQEKLATHTLYHTMREATKCTMCQRNFRSIQSLQKHMDQVHSQMITAGTSSECSSPRTVSPSGSEIERPLPLACRSTSTSDKVENESNRSVTPGQDLCPKQSPGSTLNDPQTSTSLTTHQQQQMAALTALIKQQQTPPPSEILHHLQMQQQQQFQNLPALHNLQQMQQQLPQLAAAAAASGLPLNPVEMLNLMQFHHLMSLNFMNLAPPLIFGGNTAATATLSTCGSNPTTSAAISTSSVSTQPPPNTTTSADVTAPSTSTGSTAPAITTLPNVDVNVQMMQQQQTSPGASNSQLTNNQKRARTRITDEQLKILRAHFDINNSPSEESILEMSQKANLPMKVVKHWFRNTLFKERQRNKDSPYNFNNPPSTTLNLEEYERTGQTKVVALAEQMQQQQQPQIPSRPSSAHSNSNISEYSSQQQQQQLEQKQREEAETLRSQASSVASSTFPLDVQIKTEPGEDLTSTTTTQTSASVMSTFLKQQQQQQPQQHQQQKVRFQNLEQHDHDMALITEQHLSSAALAAAAAQQQQHAAAVAAAATFYNSYETKSESGSSEMHSRPQTPNSNTTSNLYASMNDLLSQQLENMPLNQMGPPKKFQLNPSSNPCSNINSTTSERSTNLSQTSVNVSGCSSGGITVSSKLFEKNSPSAQYDTNSNSSNSSTTSSGKRANRTRFTDYQIKVLQEFFENNSYPKDSDLEYLSKLLLLSPRVIVVWFQNARQKQRKIYENQPNNSLYESEEKKQNINYACKKCSLVFQRYYELIRHQKNHCFKEENNKKSAKAQIAAAQIAQNLSSEDSNSSMDINSAAAAALLAQHQTVVTTTSLAKNTPLASEFSPLPSNTTPPCDPNSNSNNEQQKFECDKCKMAFAHFEHLREHQLMHLVNPNLQLPGETHATATAAAVAAYGPFGSILQSLQQAAHLQQAAASSANIQIAAKKRKYSETSSNADEVSSVGGLSLTGVDYDSHAKKYNFLYQYFLQNEDNSDMRQQFHSHDSAELNIEFLANYYQQTELKKRNNYDFLFQYYITNEQQTNANFELAENSKPNIEFLLQYYQLCESKKFFQLEASPQRIHDGTLAHAGLITSQHNIASISRPASNDSNSSSHVGSGIYEESNGCGVLNNSPQATSYTSIEINTQQNGQHSNSNNNNNNDSLETEKENRNFSPKIPEDISSHCASKMEEQMDQLDGLQEVKNPTTSNQSMPITIASPFYLQPDPTPGAGTNYQNLEDFLDATMIENHNQTLTFPTASNKKETLKPSLLTPTSPTHTIQPVAAASDSAENNLNHKQTNKRLRTTILPEQLNFLYECYQNESNPSRKMLEEIAKKVSLKKRVVQVWFQNSRAKDKKSRNQQRQHFSNISDENSNSSSMTIPLPNVTTTSSELSNDIIRDCNLCQVSQVNIQQHAFTVEHIRKVKELLAQTTTAAAAATATATLLNSDPSDRAEFMQNGKHQQTAQQQQQLALMMMALQSQHMAGNNSGNFNTISVRNDDVDIDYKSIELTEPNLGSKSSAKPTKTKRNPVKKKNYTLKSVAATKAPTPLSAKAPTADGVPNDKELFLDFKTNLAGNCTLDSSTVIRPVKKHKTLYNRVNMLTLRQDDENDGTNNHDEQIPAKQLDNMEVVQGDKQNNKNNCETIQNANNNISKLYNCNQISVMEGK